MLFMITIRVKKFNAQYVSYLLLLCFAIFLSACYENKEGCLEDQAVNYDFSADEPCLDCCRYPSFSLSLKYLYGSESFQFNTPYKNDAGQSFVILDQKFYLSNISVTQPSSESLSFIETEDFIDKSKNKVVYTKDYKLVEKNPSSIIVNQYKGLGSISGFKFTFGLDEKFNALDTNTVNDDLDLATTNKMIAPDAKYIDLMIKCVAGPLLKDTLSLNIKSKIPFEKKLPLPKKIVKGSELNAELTIDYKILFTNVTMTPVNKAAMEAKIGENIKAAIK
jgi:hypothetical protein